MNKNVIRLLGLNSRDLKRIRKMTEDEARKFLLIRNPFRWRLEGEETRPFIPCALGNL